MRIAILCFGTSGRGGMETAIATILQQFAQQGDVAQLFLLGGSKDTSWLSGLSTIIVGLPKHSKARRYLSYVTTLPWVVKKFSPEIILCADPRAILVAALLKKTVDPKIVVISWLHFTLRQLTNLRNLRYADAHFAISSGIAQELRERGFNKTYLVHNPIRLATSLLHRSDIATFLYLGRLTLAGQKRTDDFLRALAMLKGSFKAVMIGSGTDEDKLRDLAEQLGLSGKVQWLGWQQLPWQAAPPCSAFVLTSAYEGFALALAEAISHGLPAVSTDCRSGPSDIIIPNINGWLVPVGDIEALSVRMQHIVNFPLELPSAADVAQTVVKFSAPSVIATMKDALNKELIRLRGKYAS